MYGQLPIDLGFIGVTCPEMMFYQDLPIKLKNSSAISVEERIRLPFTDLIGKVACDFVGAYGLDSFIKSYMYISCKSLFQQENTTFNRQGWHTDGFGTEDINYIWSDSNPTVFNNSSFCLSRDDCKSMQEMHNQAIPSNDILYENGHLLRLNQFVVHRVNPLQVEGLRTFCKITFSKDVYNLQGNAHNNLLDYKWEMRSRGKERNVPQYQISNNT